MFPFSNDRKVEPEPLAPAIPHPLSGAAVIVLSLIVLAATVLVVVRPTIAPDADSGAAARDVRDGWMSYLGAAAQPAEREVQDGWSSYLLVDEPQHKPVRDGGRGGR